MFAGICTINVLLNTNGNTFTGTHISHASSPMSFHLLRLLLLMNQLLMCNESHKSTHVLDKSLSVTYNEVQLLKLSFSMS